MAEEWDQFKRADEWGEFAPVATPAPEGKTPATAGERAAAGVGGVNTGIAGLLGLPVDTAENLINLAIAGYGTAKTAITGKPGPELLKATPGGSESIKKLMAGSGIQTTNPRPDDPAARMLNTAGRVAGGSVVPGASVRSAMAAATGSAVAGEALGPEWEGLGAVAPAGAAAAVRGVRAGIAEKAGRNVNTFGESGTTPSVGQATENSFLQGLENLISKFPGGAGVMRRFTEGQQASIGAQAKTGVATEDAGRAIEKGIRGEGGFIDRTKAKWQVLDANLAAKVKPTTKVTPTNTADALDELTTVVPGAEQSTSGLVSKAVAELRGNFADDLVANNGVVPYEALRVLRTRVGAKIDNALVSDVPVGELKKLYGALSEDMKAAAKAAGAEREFSRQQAYYSARMDRIDNVLSRVLGSGKEPEKIFESLAPKNPDEATKVRAVMRSLEPAERKVVTDAIVNRMGRALPGKQNEAGEIFSTETFLSNWNKMSGPAKQQLFNEPEVRANMEHIAKTAANIREGSKVFSNVSGSAGSLAGLTLYTSPAQAIAVGSVTPMVGAAAAATMANISARMLTSSKVVKWLAQAPKITRDQSAAHLARLATIYNSSDDEELKADLSAYMESIGK